MLQACLNGGRTKSEYGAVPITANEMARDAAAAKTAGADQLHIHPRNISGSESLDPDDVAACLTEIRRAVPGMPVGVGTGTWIEPTGIARLDLIGSWQVLPNYASVNLNEEDAPQNISLLLSKGIGVEAGLWCAEDAEHFVTLPDAGKCLRVLIEMRSDDPKVAEVEYRRTWTVVRNAGIDLPILLHGEGGSIWHMVRTAKRDGHDTRVGFEDGLNLPDNSLATSNGQIVAAASAIFGESRA